MDIRVKLILGFVALLVVSIFVNSIRASLKNARENETYYPEEAKKSKRDAIIASIILIVILVLFACVLGIFWGNGHSDTFLSLGLMILISLLVGGGVFVLVSGAIISDSKPIPAKLIRVVKENEYYIGYIYSYKVDGETRLFECSNYDFSEPPKEIMLFYSSRNDSVALKNESNERIVVGIVSVIFITGLAIFFKIVI